MSIQHLDSRVVRAEIDARYPRPRRIRRDSSLEIIRRTMARLSREENSPGQPR
jgi:hypothetical protein